MSSGGGACSPGPVSHVHAPPGVPAAPAAPDALPNEKMRPLTLAGQLDKLAALTRGEAVDLATLQEALSVQEIVEGILAA